MDQIMASLQSQPGAGTTFGATIAVPFSLPQMQQLPQQQPGLQLAWQGWQPQVTFGGQQAQRQQWVQLPHAHLFAATQPQATTPSQQPSVSDITAAVAAAMVPVLQQHKIAPSEPTSRDEQFLIETLKKAKAEGKSPCEALEKLDNVNGHSHIGWKNYVLRNLERLYPRVYPIISGYPSSTNPLMSRSHRYTRETASAGVRQRKVPPTQTNVHTGIIAISNSSSSEGRIHRKNQPHSSSIHASSHKRLDREHRHHVQPTLVGDPLSASRPKRGGPVAECHAGTLISPSDVMTKPEPPRAAPICDRSKFTDDDKKFFIHFLRWRLRKGNVPGKSQLYDELAKEIPHHTADAWRRHWGQNSELPDRILASAKKRALQQTEEDESDDREGGDTGEDGEEESLSEVENSDIDNPPRPARRYGHSNGVRITEHNLRTMAQYKAERLYQWNSFNTKQGPWEEFAARKENAKIRSLNAWTCAARDHSDELQQYLQEYLAEQEKCVIDKATPPSPVVPSSSSANVPHGEAGQLPSLSRKRIYELDEVGNHAHTLKRMRQDEPDFIEVSE